MVRRGKDAILINTSNKNAHISHKNVLLVKTREL